MWASSFLLARWGYLELPVAILSTAMAAPITSPGRFSPRVPLGIGLPRRDELPVALMNLRDPDRQCHAERA
jgi:hypothetical protein